MGSIEDVGGVAWHAGAPGSRDVISEKVDGRIAGLMMSGRSRVNNKHVMCGFAL
jgi:hypothetical protein